MLGHSAEQGESGDSLPPLEFIPKSEQDCWHPIFKQTHLKQTHDNINIEMLSHQITHTYTHTHIYIYIHNVTYSYIIYVCVIYVYVIHLFLLVEAHLFLAPWRGFGQVFSRRTWKFWVLETWCSWWISGWRTSTESRATSYDSFQDTRRNASRYRDALWEALWELNSSLIFRSLGGTLRKKSLKLEVANGKIMFVCVFFGVISSNIFELHGPFSIADS